MSDQCGDGDDLLILFCQKEKKKRVPLTQCCLGVYILSARMTFIITELCFISLGY